MRKEVRSSLEYTCMEMSSYRCRRAKELPEAFLRRPYKYTIAETKDETQEKLHEFDYLK